MTVDRSDVQGNLVSGYGYPVAAHLFARAGNASALRRWLRGIEVTSDAAFNSSKPDVAQNVGLNHTALRVLCGADALGGVSVAFTQGMLERADDLGDDRGSFTPLWNDADVWVSLYASSPESLESRVAGVRRAAESFGVALCPEVLDGRAILDGASRMEHFGFRDGMSNPVVEGIDGEAGPGTGKLSPDGRWVPIRTGEFLLGHPNESEEPPMDRKFRPLAQDGSFVVFRQLHQDVAGFRRYTKEAGERFGLTADEVAAKIVGRTRQAEPLAHGAKMRPGASNDFVYAGDPDGAGCPLGAHVRRANPRDSGGVTEIVARHRILRRGMPYGAPLPDGALDDDGTSRGLLFIAVNANIERQFEFVQKRWLCGASSSGLGDDQDPLLSACGAGRMVIQGDARAGTKPILLTGLPRFVSCRGGEYYFMPASSALAALLREPSGAGG